MRLIEGRGRDGLLTGIMEGEYEDIIIARVGSALVELPRSLSSELRTMMNEKIRTARLDGKYRVGRYTEEPQSQPHKAPVLAAIEQIRRDAPRKPRPQVHNNPVLEAIEQIREDLPCKPTETANNGDLPAILKVLENGPAKVAEIAMQCHLSDEAARRRLKILADSGKVEHEKIHRVVSGRHYEFPTKRWQLIKR